MKIWIALVFLLFSFMALAQSNIRKNNKSVYSYVSPPGTVQLKDSLFIDHFEVHNIGYLEYLHYIKKDSTREFYISQLPDSSCWENGLLVNGIFEKYYFRYPGYRFYPVIGVSYDQAVNFCKWRSAKVTNSYQNGLFGKKNRSLKEYEVEVEYRLPTKEEWELAAAGGLNLEQFPYGLRRPLKSKSYTFKIKNKPVSQCLLRENISFSKRDIIHQIEFNVLEDFYFKTDGQGISCKSDSYVGPEYIYSNAPNSYQVYNLIGNVTEMTSIKGIAKGGSFKNSLSEITIGADFTYVKPTEWLGFRCIAIVHLKKKEIKPNSE